MRKISAYVHFPWCEKKCPYCDFTSYRATSDEIPQRAYTEAVLRELRERATDLGHAQLESIFFGGGTPSLWDASHLGSVVRSIIDAFAQRHGQLEVTVECNPYSLDHDKVTQLRDVGVTRLSIGVQALDSQRLSYLGRLHSGAQALDALRKARRVFEHVSADMIYGLPGLTCSDFVAELEHILATGVRHLSVYGLTIEPNTQFGHLHRKGKLPLAQEADVAETFLATREYLQTHGFAHYEVSNYAVDNYQSQHNNHYWRGGEYLGLGVGAVGCLAACGSSTCAMRYRNATAPKEYISAQHSAPIETETLDAETLMREALMLGLRTLTGIDLNALKHRLQRDLFAGREGAIERQLQRGNLIIEHHHLRVPPSRWLHLDGIVADLF